jgi:AbiV family abortive infection protein
MPWKIPKEDYYQGIRLCRRNARTLYNKSVEAFHKDCFHAAYMLGFSAMEEIGKAIVILNHWEEEHITFDTYLNEICNHSHKISLTLGMTDANSIEYFARTPREAIHLLEDEETKNLLIRTKVESIYVDYNFSSNKWNKPLKQMDDLALKVIQEVHFALRFFGNELRHRGIKIQY